MVADDVSSDSFGCYAYSLASARKKDAGLIGTTFQRETFCRLLLFQQWLW